MRKDYMAVSEDAGASETDFVREYWTRIWDRSDLGKDALERVRTRAEFRLMEPILKILPNDARILDGGCGPGAWTLALSSLGYNVTGMDLSERTIQKLRELFPKESFVAGDLRATTFADETFDACFAWGVFEHFETGLGPCLQEARRIIKKNGYLFVSVPLHNGRLWRRDHRPLATVDPDYAAGEGYAKTMRFYQWRLTEQELRRELEMHGFHVHGVEKLHKRDGVHRMLVTDWGLQANSVLHDVLVGILSPLLPAGYVAHMVVAAGQKR